MTASCEQCASTLEPQGLRSCFVCCFRQMLAAMCLPTTTFATGFCALLAFAYPLVEQTSVSCETLALPIPKDRRSRSQT